MEMFRVEKQLEIQAGPNDLQPRARFSAHRMLRRSLMPAVLLLLTCASAVAQQSETLSLDGTWQFAMAKDDAAAQTLAGFYDPAYNPSAFVPTPVPSNWALQGFEEPHYGIFSGEASEGFYLRHFTIPAGFEKQRVLLHFGGVWCSAEIWLNGKPLGRHDSGFTSFSYDVASLLKPGADNLLAVRVRQVQHDYLFDTNDDWSWGGIYRDVTLEAMPHDRWIDRVDVQTTFDNFFRDADLDVRVMVGDQRRRQGGGNIPGGSADTYDLRLTLKDQSGHEVQTQQINIPSHNGTDRQTIVRFHVLSPLRWTAETPNLYALSTTLLEAGKPSHEVDRTIGFRQVSTKGGIFTINGQAVKLRGVDRHDEYPDVGRATTPANWLQDITLMKAANINMIRNSHYPPAEGFLDLCDKMGMYVEDEVPMGYGGDHANDPSFTAAVMLRSYETVERDINHPAIIMYSIGNEDPLTSLHIASARTVKGLDPTRPLLMPWRAEQWMPEEFDILAPHYLTAQQMDEMGAISTRPVFMSEYTHAYDKDGFGGLEDRWKALIRHASGAGGAIWMWADQGVEVATRKPDGTLEKKLRVVPDGFDGIVGPYREPQRDYWETKAVYAQTYPAVDKVEFTIGQAVARIPIQNDFDFTDLKTVKIAWTLLEDAQQLGTGSANIDGPPHAARVLEVPLSEIKQLTAGATYTVRFAFQHADGSEITTRTVELLPRLPPVAIHPMQKIVVSQAGKVSVTVGDSSYTFDPKLGQLVSAAWKGTTIVSDMRPTIWRPLTSTESGMALRDLGLKELPDLNNFVAAATEWKLDQQPDRVTIHTTVACKIDEKNRFTAVYDYTIDATGKLSVHYSLSPEVQVHWISQTGLSFTMSPAMKQLRWLGLGPLDTFPNEKVAGVLGVWSGPLGSETIEGNKSTRWIEVSAPGSGVRFQNDGYMRLDSKQPSQIQLLSAVLGRTSKARRPEDPEQQLNVVPGKPFVGELSLQL
jgi:beta-galactosidase